MLAAVDLVPRHVGRLEVRHDRVEQLSRLGGVVGAVVADVDVERQPLALRPGVHRKVGLGEHQAAREARALELMEAHADGRETGRLHQLHALGAEFLALEKELRIAAAAGEVADKMQTVHSSTPQNAKAQPAVNNSRLRLPFASCGAKQRSSIVFNSCRASYSLATSPRISADTASIKRRAIEILLGSLGNCNTSNQFASDRKSTRLNSSH